ncbi:lysoplasmalogenase [Belliella sp. R4-6]|uniref:Lysoplasmalogenase n=1 Tax=Belliella alkalica TaxID=1730871 RepID=A0ABS9VDL0_9BACT|nr:lysoplasmalogenase [Belliella alkalica]MCH7413978.1 lysoplasmalogenase [Belliella alkalica]
MTIHPRFTLTYLTLTILNLSFLLIGCDLIFYITKPLIVPILLYFLFLKFKSTKHRLIPPLMIATFFSFLGDVFLMFKIEESLFKLLGLCTFIVAQTAYAVLYHYSTSGFEKKDISPLNRWPEALAILVTITTTIIIFPNLGAYVVPIIFYALFSTTAIVLSLNRRFYVSQKSFVFTILGVFSFFLSDLLMGEDIVLVKNVINHFLVLLFYFIGHLLIINGMMLQINNDLNEKKSGFL